MDENINNLTEKLKKLEAEMQKLESSLVTNKSDTIDRQEKLAVKQELENRLELLRREKRFEAIRGYS